eukprot:TRINITY_DN4747_c0_g2_i1.p1 TRINITY_DN4747_c0_g2~~TRINITY_DN4747_c0_g2_i1.p1  ORF type:complete len:374 (+),score=52.25 TRINITY_DN4747_c0_g2_i1:74-1123(+)
MAAARRHALGLLPFLELAVGPTPLPPGSARLSVYTDRECNDMLFAVSFQKADGTCEEVEVGGEQQWAVALCDRPNRLIHFQTGYKNKNECQKAGAPAKIPTAYHAPLRGSFSFVCDQWMMVDPHNSGGGDVTKGVELSVSMIVDPSSCGTRAPTPAPTPKPTPPPPVAQCGAFQSADEYGCGGGSGWKNLSPSHDPVNCLVACRNHATQTQTAQCCYLGKAGCFALSGGKVTHNQGDTGRAMICGFGKGPAPPSTPAPESKCDAAPTKNACGPPGISEPSCLSSGCCWVQKDSRCFSVPEPGHGGGGMPKWAIGAIAGAATLVVAGGAAGFFFWRRRRESEPEQQRFTW